MDLEALTDELSSEFDILAKAGEEYDPRNWEALWSGFAARWVFKFLLSASISSNESTCYNRHTGATLIDIKKQKNGSLAPFILTSCFNGAPTGIKPCTSLGYCNYKKRALEDFCRKHNLSLEDDLPQSLRKEFRIFKAGYSLYCQAIHAEANAIFFSPVNPQGKMLFSTTNPCPGCARMLVQNGIAAVVYSTPYKKDPRGRPHLYKETEYLFKEAKIPCVQISLPEDYMRLAINSAMRAGENIPDRKTD